MHKIAKKLLLCLLLFCLAAPGLYGLDNAHERLDNLLAQAIQGNEEAIAAIGDIILHQELDTTIRGEYIEALVRVAQAGIPSAQEIFYRIVIDCGREVPFHDAAIEAFTALLPVFVNIINDRECSDLLMISAIRATIGVFYLGGRGEAPINMLYENLDRLKDLLKNNYPDEARSDDLKEIVAYALGMLLLYDDLANLNDICEVFKEILSDLHVSYLLRARLSGYLRTVVTREGFYEIKRVQMAYDLIIGLIPTIEQILLDEKNWALDDLIIKTLRDLETAAFKKNEQAIGLIEKQIPQFKALSTEKRAKSFVESIVSVLITAFINGSQPANQCLVSLISDEAYTDIVKEVSIGKLAKEARNGDQLAAFTISKAYARMAGVNNASQVPSSEFLWPDEEFPYRVLKELLTNRVVNSLNPESLLNDTRPLALMIFAKAGEPQVSDAKKLLASVFVEAGCRVLLYEAGTDRELCEVAEEATPLNIKADITLIMGHGSSEGGVLLGSIQSNSHELYRLDSSDMEEMKRFGSRLADGAVVVFFSCLLGKGREDNKESVPNKFAEAVPHIGMIISADGVIYVFNAMFEFDSKSRLTNANFSFKDPHDDMYIIKLIKLAIVEKARMKLTTVGKIRTEGDSITEWTPRLTYHLMKPEYSALLQNFPNPFNPDTWIPYQLKEDADVEIKIYTVNGQLVRALNLGRKPAGLYTTRNNAVYWNGKNESGEYVSSGVYLYIIHAGNYVATKKMVLAK